MRHQIRKAFYFKNYVFLLSVFEGSAYWSAHEWNGGNAPLVTLAAKFQKAHDMQVNGLIKQAKEDEPAEFREQTIDDQTGQAENN